ncbi:MAG: hypothetical protein IH899_21245 [Planctomycetes bacterium]|nr:hypothetical protein [Planctomycetota bacterium]
MRSHPGGNLTAVLMFAVLLSVPLLAVFGIPEFVPASNSLSERDEAIEKIHFRSSTTPGVGESASYSSSGQPEIYAPVRNVSSDLRLRDHSQAAGRTEQIRNPFLQLEETDQIFREQSEGLNSISATDALAGWELANTQTASRSGSSAFRTKTLSEPQSTASAEDPFSEKSFFDLEIKAPEITRSEMGRNDLQNSPLTWRSAVRRLNALGIRQFRLEPGSREYEFHFSCSLILRNNPRVTHRFEAEAGDPLRAVEKVLQQITLWQQER